MSHRSAAAFVDAEARLFLQDAPLGPGDRVLAGLSVAFDASCEEMWLAWRHGACLVPAPRSLVRSGEDLAPWLVRQAITVVSTVPTLAAMWPTDSIENVRLLIFGGEAVPARARRAAGGRRPRGVEHVRPHRGDGGGVRGAARRRRCRCGSGCRSTAGRSRSSTPRASRSPRARSGELIIGGVGLARYLDPAKDAEKYAPMPTLGWDRAYRSGDLVRFDAEGLVFQGRADDQVKVGGRRIELGEVEIRAAGSARRHGRGRRGAHDRRRRARARRLPGRATPASSTDRRRARRARHDACRPPIVPLLARRRRAPGAHVGQGRPRRAAVAAPRRRGAGRGLHRHRGVARRAVAGGARDAGARPHGRLLRPRRRVARRGAARLAHPRARAGVLGRRHLRRAAPRCDGQGARSDPDDDDAQDFRQPEPTPRSTQWVQTLVGLPLFILTGIRWLLYLLTASALLQLCPGFEALPTAPWWVLIVGLLLFATPFGRMTIVGGVRTRAARRPAAGRLPSRRQRRTCGCGSPSRSPTRSTRSVSPAHRGSRTTRARSARRSGATSTCTRCRPSPACSRSATAPPSSPRSTCAATGSTATSLRLGAGAHRRRRHDRRAQHARPRHPHRPARRDRARLGRVRPRARRSVLGRLARRPRRRRGRGLADSRPPADAPVALGLRRVARAARPASRSPPSRSAALVLAQGIRGADTPARCLRARRSLWLVPATLTVGFVFAASVVLLVRLLSIGLRRRDAPGPQPRSAGRPGPSSDCSTPRARSSSRCTRVCSHRSGCGCWAPRSAGTSRHRPSCSSRR